MLHFRVIVTLTCKKYGPFRYIEVFLMYQYQYVVQPDRLNYWRIGACLWKGFCISMTDCERTKTGVKRKWRQLYMKAFKNSEFNTSEMWNDDNYWIPFFHRKGLFRVEMHSLLLRPGSDNSISLWCKLRHTIDLSNYRSWFAFWDNCFVCTVAQRGHEKYVSTACANKFLFFWNLHTTFL